MKHKSTLLTSITSFNLFLNRFPEFDWKFSRRGCELKPKISADGHVSLLEHFLKLSLRICSRYLISPIIPNKNLFLITVDWA